VELSPDLIGILIIIILFSFEFDFGVWLSKTYYDSCHFNLYLYLNMCVYSLYWSLFI
jgi:hypothetical protein